MMGIKSRWSRGKSCCCSLPWRSEGDSKRRQGLPMQPRGRVRDDGRQGAASVTVTDEGRHLGWNITCAVVTEDTYRAFTCTLFTASRVQEEIISPWPLSLLWSPTWFEGGGGVTPVIIYHSSETERLCFCPFLPQKAEVIRLHLHRRIHFLNGASSGWMSTLSNSDAAEIIASFRAPTLISVAIDLTSVCV